jgi:protein TonB
MRSERTSVAEEGLVSLRNCFLEGSAEEEKNARKVRRRAILTSIIVQILVVAALVLYPMLSHGERLPFAVFTPTVPYSHHVGDSDKGDHHPHGAKTKQACRFCQPLSIPNTIVTTDHDTSARNNPGPDGTDIPGTLVGDDIPGAPFATGPESGPVKPQQEVTTHEKKRISVGHIEPAMLVHRVEPIYPPLPLQMHHEGRVELRAIIATDGTIQSLQAVSGDPLFYASALAAVREWRYRPTILDGQAVEIDTHITVIYTLNH